MQQDLRDLVKERFQVEPEHQNIFFQGMEMEDEFTMYLNYTQSYIKGSLPTINTYRT